MIIVALILLGATAVLPPVLALWKLPDWFTACIAATLLSTAAIAATYTHKVHGFPLALTALLSVLAAAVGGLKIAPLAFRLARRQQPVTESEAASQPLQGGLIIGLLERVAISAAILAGWPEGMAIVLAVKGLARYPELREPHASEQFIIGTFASVLWAIAAGGIGRGMFS